MSYIISIDASTTNTGVAVYRETKSGITYETHCLLSYPKNANNKYGKNMTKAEKSLIKHQNTENRVEFMIMGIYKLLDKYQPQSVIIEDIYARTDINTMKVLGRIQGAVLGWTLAHSAEIQFFAPNSWRSLVGFKLSDDNGKLKRELLKEASKQMVFDIFGLKVTDDEADALLIGYAYIRCKGFDR